MKMNPDEVLTSLEDASEWGDPEPARPRKSEKRQRGIVVSVRLSPEEFELVEKHASSLGMPLGTFMRQQALACMTPAVATTWMSSVTWSRPAGAAGSWHTTVPGLEQSLQSTNY
ncbi:hypothetical protein [Blastococcus sp. CCUG 61487]|uniref:plasmid mobilization protein n=1 Tax=Blastococcus sp. CCUG 61487 TaxID=1840703 RepID=UPI0010C0AF0C|nr:hypothetical protein [Blastococcus sp. CCUG 61487]TKJ18928.1 hypothetical protein A6V29_00795 [Blastococcus sp. CCUG 61487]